MLCIPSYIKNRADSRNVLVAAQSTSVARRFFSYAIGARLTGLLIPVRIVIGTREPRANLLSCETWHVMPRPSRRIEDSLRAILMLMHSLSPGGDTQRAHELLAAAMQHKPPLGRRPLSCQLRVGQNSCLVPWGSGRELITVAPQKKRR
jgi:hypothetical protein